HSGIMADETELIPETHWERSVLFQDLPLHTSYKKLKIRFKDLMEDVTFINRRDKVTYTRCGVLRMRTREDADLILKKSHHDFYGVDVHVERLLKYSSERNMGGRKAKGIAVLNKKWECTWLSELDDYETCGMVRRKTNGGYG
ncbi:nucleotide-binding alpha-beta plait domain-containing protein, partial [Tanacetum coccineum]